MGLVQTPRGPEVPLQDAAMLSLCPDGCWITPAAGHGTKVGPGEAEPDVSSSYGPTALTFGR